VKKRSKSVTRRHQSEALGLIIMICLLLSGDIHPCPGPHHAKSVNSLDFTSDSAVSQVRTLGRGTLLSGCIQQTNLPCSGSLGSGGGVLPAWSAVMSGVVDAQRLGSGTAIMDRHHTGSVDSTSDLAILQVRTSGGSRSLSGYAQHTNLPRSILLDAGGGVDAGSFTAEESELPGVTTAAIGVPRHVHSGLLTFAAGLGSLAASESDTDLQKRSLLRPLGNEGNSAPLESPLNMHNLKSKAVNQGILKNKKWGFFQTVNQSRTIWDPKVKPKGLLGGHLNIRSIISKSEQIHHLLLESNLDFLCLSETWLHENSPSAALEVPGFKLYRRDRVGSKGGGVMIYVKTTIQCKEIAWADCMDLECIGLNLILAPQMSFVLIVIYRPPSSNITFYENLKQLLKQCDFNKEVIIMGDFNINWEDKTVRKNLKQITDHFDMKQIINGPTRITNSTSSQIDLIFSNRAERILKTFNMLTGLSEHNLILVARKLSSKRFIPFRRKYDSYGIPKRKLDDFRKAVHQIEWEDILIGKDQDEDSQIFSKKLESIINDFSCKLNPKNKKYTVPWINSDILKLMKKRDLALKTANRSKFSHDRQHFAMLRNKVVKSLRKAKADFFLRIINEARGNSQTIWNRLSYLKGDNRKDRSSLELMVNGKLTNNPADVAEALNYYFVDSVVTIAQCFSPKYTETHTVNTDEQALTLRAVSELDVIRTITS